MYKPKASCKSRR